MRKALFTSFLLILALAVPLAADEKHQSYFAYDDGGTLVRQGDDGREIEARVNMPVYPGDEVITNRRGRAEIRLSDGNIIAVDRATSIFLKSVLDSYEGDAAQTVIELRQGKIAVHRTELGRDLVRIDTKNASYVASHEAVYSIEADSRGKDRVSVFGGALEVRTRERSTRLRSGEGAEVDDRGLYDLVSDSRSSADDFERWFIRRAERRDGKSHRYLDRRLAYYGDDLDDHGTWINVAGIGWSWRPFVAAGWRPYHNGYWHNSRYGCLTWVSYDPFGWTPYHYGRWAYDSFHGWVWVPGSGYSPAWVYWWYGPSYVGWAPAGWWDCHRPYYDWAYRPYHRTANHFGFGFYGRVRVNEIDLRPWTFMDADTLISNRVDRASLTADAIKQRLGRTNGGFATVSNEPARFTREQFRNPADAVNAIARRGFAGTGRENLTGDLAGDMTPFFRRDADVSSTVRERITRARGGDAPAGGPTTSPRVAGGSPSTPADGGGLAPIGRGSAAPIGRGSVAPIDGSGGLAPIGGGRATTPATGSGSTGTVNRGGSTDSGSWRGGTTRGSQPAEGGSGRVNRGGSSGGDAPAVSTPEAGETSGGAVRMPSFGRKRDDVSREGSESTGRSTESADPKPREESWRNRVSRDPESSSSPRSNPPADSERSTSRGGDAPRRVIEGIGGTRVSRDTESTRKQPEASSGERQRSSGSTRSETPRPSRDSGARVERPSSSGSSGSSSSGSSTRSAGSSERSSAGSPERSSGGSSRGEGGRIKRD